MNPTVEKRRAFIINLAFYGIILAAFYLIFKTFFGVLVPFIIAAIIASFLHKPVQYIEKKTPLKRSIPSIIGVFLVFGIVATLIALGIIAAIGKLKDFFAFLSDYLKDMSTVVVTVREWLFKVTALLPDSLSATLNDKISVIADGLIKNGLSGVSTELGAIDWSSLISSGGNVIKNTLGVIPTFIVGLIVTIISSVFMTIDYDRLYGFVARQIKEDKREKISYAFNVAKTTLTKMVTAYAKIMAITFSEVTAGLFILYWCRIFEIESASYIPIIGMLTAIVDIIPVLGTGTVLIPWAVVSFILGKYYLGIGLLCMYVIIFVIRQVLEPKLVSGMVGLPPFITIAAMYIGTKTLGVLGFFILPFIVIILKEFNKKGILHWLKFAPEDEEDAIPATEENNAKKPKKLFGRKNSDKITEQEPVASVETTDKDE